jgi:hypothetical protein
MPTCLVAFAQDIKRVPIKVIKYLRGQEKKPKPAMLVGSVRTPNEYGKANQEVLLMHNLTNGTLENNPPRLGSRSSMKVLRSRAILSRQVGGFRGRHSHCACCLHGSRTYPNADAGV